MNRNSCENKMKVLGLGAAEHTRNRLNAIDAAAAESACRKAKS
jgi:hypothetical protein